jgi:hypothetical protein
MNDRVAQPVYAGRRAWLAVLILTPLISVGLSALLVLSILHFLASVPSSAVANGTLADPRLLRDIVEPFGQQGTEPVGQLGGVVYYPIPYATPPHLTLMAQSEGRSYAIVRQDEFGFAWVLDVGLKDVKDLAGALKDAKDLEGVAAAVAGAGNKTLPELRPGESFAWEARGVRPFTTVAATPPFVQTGSIPARANEGVEYFPHPYATPPNVTLTGNLQLVVTTPLGFRWRSTHAWGAGDWTARGLRPTPEQLAELSRNAPRGLGPQEQPAVAEDTGQLYYAEGEQGQASFTRPFLTPPNVEVINVIVTEITPRGFRWKCPGNKGANSVARSTTWKAKGILDPTGGKGSLEK